MSTTPPPTTKQDPTPLISAIATIPGEHLRAGLSPTTFCRLDIFGEGAERCYSLAVHYDHKPRARATSPKQFYIRWAVQNYRPHPKLSGGYGWRSWSCWLKTEQEAADFAATKLTLLRAWASKEAA